MDGLSQSQAGSLLDQRGQDLSQLSQILPVTTTQNSDGSVNVYSGSNYLVQGDPDCNSCRRSTAPSDGMWAP